MRVLLVAVLASALALAGCSTEEVDNAASNDGLRVELGSLLMSNIMVLSAAEGQPGTVLGAVDNNGDESVTVSVGLPDEQAQSFDVASGETLLLGPEDYPVPIRSIPAPPGATVDLTLTSTRDGSTTLAVPVLDGTFPRYEDLVPEPIN
ncbi:hypothetical protein [Sanguibacter sp. 25GB23B1]|uniref:hypothetical protein n=1 Tax=unclassified Sanguibacter TaxID=2645534 RepID=UPI0032AFC175